MSGIEASLQAKEGLRVSRLTAPLTNAAMEIKMLSPHVVIFEMRDDVKAVLATILRDHPGIKLIGLEPERDSITVFSANEQTVSSVEDLARVILERTGGKDM